MRTDTNKMRTDTNKQKYNFFSEFRWQSPESQKKGGQYSSKN